MSKYEHQGYLDHMEDKSKEDLMDLLHRQEKLHHNRKFIQRLPDRGEKIDRMIHRLRELIALRESVDDTADQFEKMALDAERARRQRAGQEEEEEEEAMLRSIINRGTTGKVYANEAQSRDSTPLVDCGGDTPLNAYDRVIRKADASKTKPRYLPNRSIHASNVHELVDRIGSLRMISEVKPSTCMKHSTWEKTPEARRPSDASDTEPAHSQDVSSTCSAPGGATETVRPLDGPRGGSTVHTPAPGEKMVLRHRYDDLLESAMPRARPRHEAAKMISLTAVMVLQGEQQKKHAESQAKQAAERLTHSLSLGMSSFEPEGSSGDALRYREVRGEVDTDSDDDLDVPD